MEYNDDNIRLLCSMDATESKVGRKTRNRMSHTVIRPITSTTRCHFPPRTKVGRYQQHQRKKKKRVFEHQNTTNAISHDTSDDDCINTVLIGFMGFAHELVESPERKGLQWEAD